MQRNGDLRQRVPGPAGLDLQEPQVEANVVADHDGARQERDDVAEDFLEGRRRQDVGCRDAMEIGIADIAPGVDQGRELAEPPAFTVGAHDGNLDHAVGPGQYAGRLHIQDRKRSSHP